MTFRMLSDSQIRDRDIDTLKRFIRHKLGGYRVAINDVQTGQRFFRGVLCETRPDSVDRVSYPPVDRVTKLGRVNRFGVSMFYCSVSPASVFYEIRAKKGDLIALSRWETTDPLWMHHVGYHQDALKRLGVVDLTMRERLTNPISDENKENARLRRELSLAFTEDIREGREYRYKQSIAINELLFDGASPLPELPGGPPSSRVAGTVYPAMRMRGAADNAAIWPDFVDRSLRIKSITYVLVEEADEARSSYTFLAIAMSDMTQEKEIIWSDKLAPEVERRSHIAFENGQWVLRDGLNAIYDMH